MSIFSLYTVIKKTSYQNFTNNIALILLVTFWFMFV